MDHSARFWDKAARRYAKSPVGDEETYQKKLEETRAHLRPDMDVLEFGCGTGSTAIAHAPYVKHIHAIDFAPTMIEIARGKADAQNIRNVTFEHSTIEELGASGRRFDAVLGLNVLHLLESKEAAIATVYQLLEPGGVFISSTVCLDMWVVRLLAPVGRLLRLMPRLKAFSARELEEALTAAGFQIEREWKHAKGRVVFAVARKPLSSASC